MKVAIHQPEYWPIPRLLAKWAQADLLVLLDIVQFDRSSLQHRCKLASPDGQLRWLTIPFSHNGTRNLDSMIPADSGWIDRHIRTIREWYTYADPARLDELGELYKELPWMSHMKQSKDLLKTYTAETMLRLADWAKIQTPIAFASQLVPPDGHWGARADLVFNLCRATAATSYLSGRAGADYLLPAVGRFAQAGIGIEIQTYPTAVEVPGLSALHTYLHHGSARLRELVTHR